MDGRMRQLENKNTELRKELSFASRTAKEVPELKVKLALLTEEKECLVEENGDINEECDTLRARSDSIVKVAKSQYENFRLEKQSMDKKVKNLKKEREALEEELWLASETPRLHPKTALRRPKKCKL
jgi:chromosome segregation ATPase